ncbi:uncharacterized protein LOC143615417 [Bidens hawaiensis]|uniref:uncharacterized protein LOC143615417 n=1 Tax=Bidens hawaiensis TaxID=980011 RepID=UPI004049D98A
MGSACCVAAKDRTITDRSTNDIIITRNDRYSPSWSFRWDNRGRVAGEDSSINDRLDNKSHTTVETAYATEGSPLGSSRSLTWQKSPLSEEIGLPQLDTLSSKNLHEVKDSRGTQTPVAMELSPTNMLTPAHSISSLSAASPLSSSQSQLMPMSSLTPSRWSRRSPGHHHLLRQVSDSRIRGMMSPNFSISEDGSPFMHHPGWTNKSNIGSHGGSSDSWSNRDRWSFDSDAMSFSRDRFSRSRVSSSPTVEIVTCGICSKLLTERSSWSSHKVMANNGLPIVSVLICGHVYHAECLENMTSEINKYDPACPVCTLGEKKVIKMSGEMDFKGKIGKKLSRRVVDGGNSGIFNQFTNGRGPVMGSSSSMKSSSSTAKPFLKRHFSFGYKPNRSFSDNGIRKKRFFWSKSSKE